MRKKKNILEICNQLGIGGTEKVMQIFCKYLDKDRYGVFACGIFRGGEREEIIKNNVSDLLVADGDIGKIKDFIIKNKIDIIHWHSVSQSPGIEFEKSIELLKFCRENNLKIIETSPFSLYNEKIDDLLDVKLFVSKTNLIKYFWKFGKKLKNENKYSFLYNPLDIDELEKYRLNGQQKKEVRKKYGIGENDFVIGKVGRANLWKWEDTIIDIVPELIKEINDLKVIIRAIPEIKKEKIKRLGIEKYFIFLPESVVEKEITDTYQVMDVMVHTSRIGESFGVALAEGMFFSVPIVTNSTNFLDFTIFDRDNSQGEILRDCNNYIITNNNKKICNYVNKIYTISDSLKQNTVKKFDAKNLSRQLEKFIEGKQKADFIYEKELLRYKENQKKEPFIKILEINIKALLDKFINKA